MILSVHFLFAVVLHWCMQRRFSGSHETIRNKDYVGGSMKVYTNWEAACLGGEHKGEYFPAIVPGNVQKDYAEFFGLGDVNYSDNYLKFGELEDYYFTYRTKICKKQLEGSFEKLYFVTKGIEYEYEILVDGEKKLYHEGMYTTTEVELTDILSDEEEHVVEILIYPHPKIPGIPWGRSQAAQSCKPAVEYDWDWHPRMLVSGIFGDTYFEGRSGEMIADVEAFYTLNDALSEANVTILGMNYREQWTGEPSNLLYTVQDADGNTVYEGESNTFLLSDVKLWWCNGQGEPYLYTYSVMTKGHPETKVSGKVGFRTIRLVMNEGAWDEPMDFPKSRSVAPVQIELNGRRVFGKGSNWVNPEIYTSNISDARYDTLLAYVQKAHMNILRIWGGAIINREYFFERCDELGIMVWQEFPLACNNYIGTDHYLKILEQEARAIIRSIRGHVSHTIWCGGNELFNVWSGMTDQSLALRLLNKLCYEMDRKKPFMATAPLEGMGHGHYTIYDNRRERLVHKIFGEAKQTAYTEFGVPAITDLDILKAIIPAEAFENIAPGTVWERRKGFGVWPEGGDDAWLNFSMVDKLIGKQDSLADYIRVSQWMQCQGLQFIFEEGRRQKPYCSLVMNWDFTEPWNNVGGHVLITYPDRPRPAYYKVADSLRNVMPSARTYELVYTGEDVLKAELWMLNDSNEEVSDTVEAYLILDGKKEHIMTWNTGLVEPNTNKCGHMLQIKLPAMKSGYITLRLEAKAGTTEYQFYVKEKVAVERDVNVLNA